MKYFPTSNLGRACVVKGCALSKGMNGILNTVNSPHEPRQRTSYMGPVPLPGTNVREINDRSSTLYRTRAPVMGFSLIELMVALTIFSIVMTISLGTLLTLIDANNKAQALSSSMTNLSFALDSISRNLRTGSEFYCSVNGNISDAGSQINNLHSNPYDGTHDCAAGGEAIVFTPGLDSSLRTAYRLNNNQIEQWVDDNSATPDGWVPITSNTPPGAVTVNSLSFMVSGTDSISDGDEVQPKITISIDGEVDAGLSNTTSFSVQTTVTQRILNY